MKEMDNLRPIYLQLGNIASLETIEHYATIQIYSAFCYLYVNSFIASSATYEKGKIDMN